MAHAPNIDGVLIQWGDRLFYPGNRVVNVKPQPRLDTRSKRQRAAAIRQRIEATVVRRAPQVMVKVTGGGRCMQAIAAHFRYISKNGRLDIEDERGETLRGRDTVHEIAEDWRFGGSLIDDVAGPGQRREAFNIMLSMPRGTDPLIVQRAAREFAQTELADHKYVMVLHDHQANPHVHISVRAESKHGRRLNPRKTDLHRWRETFAEKLRGYGIDAEATRQATRGSRRNPDALWQLKAREDGRLQSRRLDRIGGAKANATRMDVKDAWTHISLALAGSGAAADVRLSRSITQFVREGSLNPVPVAPEHAAEKGKAEMTVGRVESRVR
ncbi:MAG: conjugal transfer protein TraS [Hydrogenophaga sp.]|uniref:relaxase/mobilization nuclease domain-containing protein n=1 Tax=Hydrogenophaga sp. TaxID=1904254 RepID=UPI002AB928AF|nr:conjugal transfer protein TraS [Hydrogenophaga sp.]MDZ4282533.1 conjugal transfer protein TraS [Hydrogenophaga sp.]